MVETFDLIIDVYPFFTVPRVLPRPFPWDFSTEQVPYAGSLAWNCREIIAFTL